MSCAVDPVEWGEKNRVKVATGKTQEWVLARTQRDAPTVESVRMNVRAVLGKWFEGTPLDVMFADAGDAVDGIEITAVSEVRPAFGAKDQRREQTDPLPVLVPSDKPPLYVSVRFNYRGYAKDMPWPVWTGVMWPPIRMAKMCPFDVDWMLVQAKTLDALPTAPTEAGPIDKLAENAPGALGDVAKLTKLLGWALVAYVGFQAYTAVRTARKFT